ncbi:MAG: inositol monophosphatase [Desulfobacteraceae bacterium]|jgi:fructose-1,6-bisphosphatase/inositol monophosphatase family enzyme|nr:MAG: inositol monophosphatase [Desulfobacteraceae bacterium]
MELCATDDKRCALSTSLIDRIYDTAVDAARIAGAIQMDHFRKGPTQCTRLLYDVKLETDLVCEEAIRSTIGKAFPDHSILAEETGQCSGRGEYLWVVDPLDGTVNFWQGLPLFCVSVACYRNPANNENEWEIGRSSSIFGTPVAGVVYLPFMQEIYAAVRGRGTTMNGRPLRVTGAEDTHDLVMAVSFGKTRETMQCMTERLGLLLPRVRKVRCLGAAAAELAYVSAGYLGGLMYEGIKPWDFAAGKILVEEAGGFVHAVETGKDQWRVTAGATDFRAAIESFATGL